MSSLLTNSGAMTALSTLRTINHNLSKTQDMVATGKAVGDSRANSSLWQIAATMQSDAQGFEALTTSLSLSKATIGTARAASERVVEQITDMRERIIAANEPDADLAAIDKEVQAMKLAVEETINSAQVNGLNLLTGTDTGTFLISLNRSDATTVAKSTFTVSNATLLGGSTVVAPTAAFSETNVSGSGVDTVSVSIATGANDDLYLDHAVAVVAGAKYSLTVGGTEYAYTAQTGDDHENVTYGLINAVNANTSNGLTATIDVATGSSGDVNWGFQLANASGATVSAFLNVTGTTASTLTGWTTLDVSTSGGATTALTNVETWLSTVKGTAADLAAYEFRVDSQDETLKALTDSLKEGIGGITDADMEAAAARLQALQVQQQLGVQALSIANQQPQTILSLFR